MARPQRLLPGLAVSKLSLLLCLVFIFCSTAHAASTVLGIDLGTEYIKATLVKPGIPLEIVLTKDSRRKEAATVAFKPGTYSIDSDYPERMYGSDAVALSARFPTDVYPNLKPLLGLPADNAVVQTYAIYHPGLQMGADKIRNTVAIGGTILGENEDLWAVEELLAMELQSIQKNAEALAGKGNTVKDVVITIPQFYTAEEKRAVELAAELAGLRVLSLISDGLSVGLNYATTRTFPNVSDGEKPEIHMVFDMGAGSTKASIIKFQGRTVKDVGKFNKTIQEVEVLGSAWDRTLGGDALNALIVDDMIEKFTESPKFKALGTPADTVKTHGRTLSKLWKEAERVRQVLSANSETQASFEGLFEEVDFKYKLTRTEFERLAEPFAERIATVFKKALNAADYDEASEIDTVILHGGAIRTPFVQKTLESACDVPDKLRSNVNADEAAAFGAGFLGATLSPSFRVKEIKAYEKAIYAAGIKWINIHEKPQHQRLFQHNSHLGQEKGYTFKNQEDYTIRFYQHVPSSENVSPGGAEKDIIAVTTKNLTEAVAIFKDQWKCRDADIDVKFGWKLSSVDGLPEVTYGYVQCAVDEPEAKGVVDGVKDFFGFGKKEDQEPLGAGEPALMSEISTETSSTTSASVSDSETTSSTSTATASRATSNITKYKKSAQTPDDRRLEIFPLDYVVETRGYPPLPRAEIQRMRERLLAFEDSDRHRRMRDEAINQLESFTYKCRDLLSDDDFIAAATDAEKELLEKKSSEASEWIYEDGANAGRKELLRRLKELKEIVDPINIRREDSAQRPAEIEAFQNALDSSKKMIDNIKEKIREQEEASSSTTAPASTTTNEFEGLEVEDETTTMSAPTEIPTPLWETKDVEPLVAIYESSVAWFEEKRTAQDKLTEKEDPVLLSKDLRTKSKAINDAVMDLLMKSVRTPPKKKSSSSKKSSTKTKKSSSTSTPSETLVDEATSTIEVEIPGETEADHVKDEL